MDGKYIIVPRATGKITVKMSLEIEFDDLRKGKQGDAEIFDLVYDMLDEIRKKYKVN